MPPTAQHRAASPFPRPSLPGDAYTTGELSALGAASAAAFTAMLDHVAECLDAGRLEGMDRFVRLLNALRTGVSREEWMRLAGVLRGHAAMRLIHHEPFTRRAFEKPRGYAGDAPMLDMVYGDVGAERPTTPLGERLHAWMRPQPACRSVRERRDILAALIDRVAAGASEPRVVSVACGHLREAQRSEAVRAGAVAEFVAFDQDAESLAVVEREQAAHHVVPVRGSVRRLLAAPLARARYDLVYSAGLYDYLARPVAEALTASLFGMVRPGGTLLVANFAPELRDIGYMEAVMDWHLTYRTEAEVAALGVRIPPEEVAESTLYRDTADNVVYLQVRRA